MNFFVDNPLLRKISTFKNEDQRSSLLKACINAHVLTENQQIQIAFGWPSLLEYLNLGSLFQDFPKFDQQEEPLQEMISILSLQPEREQLIHLYDQLFVHCLTHVKALPEIHPHFLLNQIQEKSPNPPLFALSLDSYKKAFLENPSHTIHDLILYLAWDRVCVNLAIVFEHLYPKTDILNHLEVLKECLVESFQHITSQGRTAPGFFRLIEALYAYQMRDENLQTHTDSEWLILCQSARTLKPRELLNDIFYVDATLIQKEKVNKVQQEKSVVKILTLDSSEVVKASLSLAHYIIEKLKHEIPDWQYTLSPVEVICLKEVENQLIFDSIIHHE